MEAETLEREPVDVLQKKDQNDPDEPIRCMIDGHKCHSIAIYLRKAYSDTWTLEKYQQVYPGAPTLSEKAKRIIEEQRKAKFLEKKKSQTVNFFAEKFTDDSLVAPALKSGKKNFHEIFHLGKARAAFTDKSNPIPVTVFEGHEGAALDYLPTVKDGYVYDIGLLKEVIVGFELNMPIYLWGMHGTGKTTILQQAAARTGRPFIRVQHTMNMQESDVLGQWTVRDGSTYYQPGPLVTAMVNGWVYCADEYDFAMPAVTAVYQPVLEGENLIIKDAPSHLRRIVPHPEFRFVATGNTNGGGDETGLYQGTQTMNAANLSRFEITEEVKYMSAANEQKILETQASLNRADAIKLVQIANTIRKSFSEGGISTTISTRELISAAKLGIAFGGKWLEGLQLAFLNRLSRVDKKTIQEFTDRVFGV